MKRFWNNSEGQVAILFTLAVPVLVACLGLAIDYASWVGQDRKLQGAADAAAVAAARELYLANASDSQILAVAEQTADAQFLQSGGSPAGMSILVQVNDDRSAVNVTIARPRETYFAGLLQLGEGEIEADATARAMGGGRICVIGLDDDAFSTISLTSSSTITANACGVYSNSTSAGGITSYKSSLLSAELICSSGGTEGGGGNFSPEPLTDCPPISDPLANRPPPGFGGCDETNKWVNGDTVTLWPGVYCGGLHIVSDSEVDFAPGVYIMKDGPLEVTGTSEIWGEHVGFYFTGNNAVFLFAKDSVVEFTAPKDGPMAGLLFFEDRNSPPLRTFEITSDDARVLVGTIYLPNGIFRVSARRPVADRSAYTAIVARRINLNKEPNLVINSDYGATDVPVPAGIGPSAVGASIILEK